MRSVVLIGAGGHCRAVADIILRQNQLHIKGLLDTALEPGSQVDGMEVLGGDNKIAQLCEQGFAMLITVGQLNTSPVRQKIANELESYKAIQPVVICNSAVIAISAKISPGTVVFPNAVVGANVRIGKNCILNSNCVTEHDSIIGNNTHISTSATVNGQCRIGSNCFVGSGSVIKQNVSLADECIVGACSFVNRDLQSGSKVLGIPTRSYKNQS